MGDFGTDSDDSDGEGGLGNVSRVIMRPPGHSGKAKRGHLCFDASFETGNLGRVDLVSEYEYDLFIRPDTCSPRYRFWFNFTVDNVKQDQRVIFNIVNISKGNNLFGDQLTPLVKSSSRPKWQRIPRRHVFYHRSQAHQGHYVLSFAFIFDKEDEVYQFALSPPYSYSRLQTYLMVLEKKAAYLGNIFSRETIANTVQNRRIDVVTVGKLTNSPAQRKKRIIIIMARIHPGESPASFVCQGLLEMIISSHPIAKILRDQVLIKIIPMLNPDGVFLGNYRSSFLGFDLNRSWHIASPWGHPTLYAVINMINAIDKNKEFQLDFVIDIHAHSSLKGCFIYGNTYEDVYRYERHTVFPKLLASNADDYIPTNMMFNADVTKQGTARRFFCTAFSEKINSYTFHVSFSGYQLPGANIFIPYTEETYMKCGRNMLRTFLEYYQLTEVIPISVIEELMPKKKRRARTCRINSNRSRNMERARPKTTRDNIIIHFTDLNINYDSSTSYDDYPLYSSRSPTRQTHEAITSCKKVGGGFMCKGMQKYDGSPPPSVYDFPPPPSLSIIDFNQITIGSLEKAIHRNKMK